MSKEVYNYKIVFEEPWKIKEITKDISLPNFVPVVGIMIYCITLGFLFIFLRVPIAAIDSLLNGSKLVIYIGVPYLASKYLMKIRPDGKKLHRYLYDLLIFYFSIYLPKKKFCHDTEAKYVNEKVVFEELRVKEAEDKYAT